MDKPQLTIDHVEVQVQALAKSGANRPFGQPEAHRGLQRRKDTDQTLPDAISCRDLTRQLILPMDHSILVDEWATRFLCKSLGSRDHLRARLLHEPAKVLRNLNSKSVQEVRHVVGKP